MWPTQTKFGSLRGLKTRGPVIPYVVFGYDRGFKQDVEKN